MQSVAATHSSTTPCSTTVRGLALSPRTTKAAALARPALRRCRSLPPKDEDATTAGQPLALISGGNTTNTSKDFVVEGDDSSTLLLYSCGGEYWSEETADDNDDTSAYPTLMEYSTASLFGGSDPNDASGWLQGLAFVDLEEYETEEDVADGVLEQQQQ